jgi:RecG-like helicase
VAEKSRLRQALSKWADSSEAHQRDLRESHRPTEANHVLAIADAPEREKVTVSGVLRTVTLRPRGGVPALEAELDDGSGVITVVWLGRRRISGVDPGRSVTVVGCIGRQSEVPLMFNPRYELLP